MPHDHRSRRRTTRTLALGLTASLIALAALSSAGCTNRLRVGVPAGLAEDEAARLVAAVDLASDAYASKDKEKSFQKYREAVQTYRDMPAAWNNLGVIMMERDQYIQAAEAFATAADISPTDPRPLYNLGLLWDRRGYLRDARGHYERALERDPSYLPALRGAVRCDSLLNEGNEDTLDWVRRALMLEQDQRWLSWLRLQKSRMENLPALRQRTETASALP